MCCRQLIKTVVWIFRNLLVHYHLCNSPPPIPILSHINSIDTLPSYSFKNHFNSIVKSMPVSTKLSLTLRYHDENSVRISHLPHSCYTSRRFHLNWYYHCNNIWWGLQITKLLIIHFSPPPCHFLPLRAKRFPITLFSYTPSLNVWLLKVNKNRKQSSEEARQGDSRPYKTIWNL